MEILKIETNFKRSLFWDVHNQKPNGKLKNQEKGLINLYPEIEFQEIIGFGGAFTQSSRILFDKSKTRYCTPDNGGLFFG